MEQHSILWLKAAKNQPKVFFRFIKRNRISKYQNILNSLNEARDSKFVTMKWNIGNDQSNANYNSGNKIIYNTEVLKSNLCDYNDA